MPKCVCQAVFCNDELLGMPCHGFMDQPKLSCCRRVCFCGGCAGGATVWHPVWPCVWYQAGALQHSSKAYCL